MAQVSRRAVLRTAAALPLFALVTPAEGEEFASAAEVFAAIDAREAEVAARLRAVARSVPAAAPLAQSVLRDHERFRVERARLRARLRLAPAPTAFPAPGVDADLQGLREALDRLVYTHAEGLPAVGNARAVHRLAAHMVEHARHLTVVDLWLERERG